jgi:serine/threonine protein kinase
MNETHSQHALPIGTMVQEYRIVRILGSGSFGIVYVAENKYFEETVALKEFLPTDLACRPEGTRVSPLSSETEQSYRLALSKFLDEARTLRELGHPVPHRNIVRVRQFIEANDTAYMVMDYEEGRPLSRILDKRGTLPEEELKNILESLLDGLERVHEAKVWHRDVKPNNILIRPDGSPVLIDFGAARREVAGADRSVMSAFTPAYAALEQVYAAGRQGPWTDIYALGATLYRAVVGKKPTNASERFLQGAAYTPAIQAAQGNYSQAFLAAIDAALELKAKDRPQSIAEWRKQLEGIYQQDIPSVDDVTIEPNIVLKSPTTLDKDTRGPKPKDSPVSRLNRFFKSVFSSPQPSTQSASQKSPQRASDNSDQASQKLEVDRTIILPLSTSAAIPAPPHREKSPLPDSTMLLRLDSSGDYEPFNEAPVALVVIGSPDPAQVGNRITLSEFPFTVGRSISANFSIRGELGISRRHIEIINRSDGYRIRDLSTNGVFLNGRRLKPNIEEVLMFGDTIILSDASSLRFVADLPWLPDMTGSIFADRYQLKRMLHESMKSAIYEAWDTRLPRKLAVKIFSPILNRLPLYQNEFRRQAEIAAILDHPHICKIFDTRETEVEVNGKLQLVPYLCMNLMAGGNLIDRLKQKPAPNVALVLMWVKALAGALNSAHEEGFIHGGLKPSCIVFDNHENPYLTDFASAKKQGESSPNVVLGAPAFLSPEQWDGKEASVATDVYSLAALVYLMVTGSRPYEGQADPEVRRSNYARGLIPAHEEAARNDRQEVPQALSKVLSKALSVNSGARYPSIQDFYEAFEQATRADLAKATANPQVFLSYRRQSSAGWAVFFSRELREKHRIFAFVDTQRRDSARRFPEKLARAVADCDIFICLLAGDTLESAWVREEIRLAFENNKPMIPVFQESYQAKDMPVETYIEALLSFDGVHLLDRRNIHVDHTIADLADIIHQTVSK